MSSSIPACPLLGREGLLLKVLLTVVITSWSMTVCWPSFAGSVLVVDVDETISPATVVYVEKAIARAEESGASCLVIRLDTPGGLNEAMRDVVQMILASRVPVVVYVSPAGARAASAGTFIGLAAHFLVMSPGTHIGAAHPVSLLGGLDETMERKVVNDSVALIRSLAEQRQRNADWAERAVRESASITAEEAVTLGVADSIASDISELVTWLHGRTLSLDGTRMTLDIERQQVESFEPGIKHHILKRLAEPDLAYILLMVAVWGILLEVFRPGLFVPGIAGGISLVLSLLSLQLVPFTTAGILLIALAAALFFLETQITSYGLLGMGGIVSLVLGSLVLLEPSAAFTTISWEYIVAIVGAGIALLLFIAVFGVKAHLHRPVTGKEGLVGLVGIAKSDLNPDGNVQVHGERWRAVNSNPDAPIQRGDSVQVVRVRGMCLFVQKQEGEKWEH